MELVEGFLDLSLGGVGVNNVNQSILIFDSLHGLFSVQRVLENSVFIRASDLVGEEGTGRSSVHGLSGEFLCFGSVESVLVVDLVLSLGLSLLVGLGDLLSNLGGGLLGLLGFLLAHCLRDFIKLCFD